ncbi:hypothetical protein BCA37_10535 [Mycobacterium sp. djl-10]|nr:hypothetical protein BCA37_10535 [Mycobacterium sp. djl-10]
MHVIFTEAGDYGWTIESPQIPELIGGRDTSDELIGDAGEIIEWAKDPDQTFDEWFGHEQHLVEDPAGRTFLIRWLFNGGDEDYDARVDTADRLNYAVVSGLVNSEEYGRHPQLPTTGECLYICVRGSDTMGWISAQLDDRYDRCVLAQHLGDGGVVHLPFGRAGVLRAGLNTEALGLTDSSTFDEMRDVVMAHEIDGLRQTHLTLKKSKTFPRHIENRLITSM